MPDPLAQGARFVEDLTLLNEHLRHHVAIRVVDLKKKVRRVVLLVVAGLIGALIAATLLIVASAQITFGLASALGALFPERPWLGTLLSGVSLLAVFALTLIAGALWIRRDYSRAMESRDRLWRERLELLTKRRNEKTPAGGRAGSDEAERQCPTFSSSRSTRQER